MYAVVIYLWRLGVLYYIWVGFLMGEVGLEVILGFFVVRGLIVIRLGIFIINVKVKSWKLSLLVRFLDFYFLRVRFLLFFISIFLECVNYLELLVKYFCFLVII